MKRLNVAVAITLLVAGMVLTGCETTTQKADIAEVKSDAREELQNAQQVALKSGQKVATAEEWRAFKSDTEEKIDKNEKRIAELKVQLNKPGEIFDKAYANRIDTLEQKNRALRLRLTEYDRNQSDWDAFKREFNHDMDELGTALKDFTVDNKK